MKKPVGRRQTAVGRKRRASVQGLRHSVGALLVTLVLGIASLVSWGSPNAFAQGVRFNATRSDSNFVFRVPSPSGPDGKEAGRIRRNRSAVPLSIGPVSAGSGKAGLVSWLSTITEKVPSSAV